ncbi:hypothetical protein LTR84_004343 [Exophiala bonariae]|uniref:Uncharacterized protein n=1 Tax=Exophiala bonariae TaxID=1690606 RepID=A0AAV9N8L2_9EURO|nr:hypothetical protein LTR84_004343 [Exophiala bonariae]
MASAEDAPPSTQADQGSLHVLQLFDDSFTVLTFEDRLALYLRTAERAHEQIQSSRMLLRGLGAEVSIPKKKSIEKTISETEYHARILAQDLDPAKSESSSPQDIIRQSRLFLVLRSENHEVSKDLESLHHACKALDDIIESCKSVRANSVKRKPLQSSVTPSQPLPVAPTPAIRVDAVIAEQPSMSQQTDDFLNGLPPLDATKLLHHRRTSRLRNRSTSQLGRPNEGSPGQQPGDSQQYLLPDDPAELPGWPAIPIPPPTARGYVFIPTLTSMPELEAPSEIISVTKAKPDYAASLRSPIIEPGVHQLQQNDKPIDGIADQPAVQPTETVLPLKQSLEKPQQTPFKLKETPDSTLPVAAQDTPTTTQNAANPQGSVSSPRNSIVQVSDAQHGTSRRNSAISERPQSLLSSVPENQSSGSAISPPSTTNSSRVSESPVVKSASTRNRLRKNPYALAGRSNIYLANSIDEAASASNIPSASQPGNPQRTLSTSALATTNQDSQTTLRQVPSVSVKTGQALDKESHQISEATKTPLSTNQVTSYTPTLTSSPQFQTSKSFTIVSPPVSPSREVFQQQFEKSRFNDSKRNSITSIASAPPAAGYLPRKQHQSAYITQQQINDAHESRLHQVQNRTYSLPETSQHKKNPSMDERWTPQRAQTQIPEQSEMAHHHAYASKLAREAREERMSSPSNVPNTSVARTPIPPYPMTPIQGPIESLHREPMPAVPTRMPIPEKQDSLPAIQSQTSLGKQPEARSSSAPVASHRLSVRFPQHNPRGEMVDPSTQEVIARQSVYSQQQAQSHNPQTTPPVAQNAPASRQQSQTLPPQHPINHQSNHYPQQQQQQQQQQQPHQPQMQYQPQTTIPTKMGGPPIPPKINQQQPQPHPAVPDPDLHRERSTSGTKSTISSRSSTFGLPQQHQQQQQHLSQHPSMNYRTASSSTLSAKVGIVGEGAGGGGSSNGSTFGAGPAVGMARKRSSWLTRQVERAGLKSF